MGNRKTRKPGVENQIELVRLFSAVTIAASGTSTGDTPTGVNLNNRSGIFSLYYTITGTGTAKIEYQISYDDVTYAEPSAAIEVGTGLTVGSDFLSFEPILAPFIRLKVTETGGANAVVVTIDLAVQ